MDSSSETSCIALFIFLLPLFPFFVGCAGGKKIVKQYLVFLSSFGLLKLLNRETKYNIGQESIKNCTPFFIEKYKMQYFILFGYSFFSYFCSVECVHGTL